jgi:ATP-dependent helicase/nuclease subunit A
MFNELTTQQFCALDYNRNIVVTSGPGAGKTKILSHRYCFILLSDENIFIPQILTLTFTEKAAEEMKTRIYQMLLDLEKDLDKKGDRSLINKIKAAKEDFNKNRISTIHSFCAGLLKEYPVEAGIDPGFNIIQGARQKEIVEESIERTLSSIWKYEKELLMPLLHSFGSRRLLINSLRDLIEHPVTFQRALSSANNLFGKKNWIDSVFRDYCRSIMDKSVIPYFNGLKEIGEDKGHYKELMDLFNNWIKEKNKVDEYFGIPGLFEKIRSLVESREPFSPTLTVKNGLENLSYVNLVEQYYPDLFVLNNPDTVLQKELELFFNTAGKCLTSYQKEKEKLNSMDFNDLETRSYLFLKDLYLNGNRDSLEGIQSSFKYIMVDEFQDTNRIQWDIIKLLCVNREEERRGHIKPGKLFVVGDKRQAIYRFRGGDVTVFEEVIKEIQESNGTGKIPMFWKQKEMGKLICEITNESNDFIKKRNESYESLPVKEKDNILKGSIYLPHNFRSDSRPIAFFNRAFKEIFGNKGARKIRNYETSPGLITLPDKESDNSESQGSVTFYLSDAVSGKDQKVEAEAALITDIIEGIMGRHGKEKYEYNAYPDIREKINNNRLSIGILFFTFNHLKTYENVLRDSGIPFSVHRDKGFYRCQEVMDMLQLLNYIVDRRQHISLLAALRSPIFGLTDPELFDIFYSDSSIFSKPEISKVPYIRKIGEQLDSWRLLSSRLTIPELIRAIISNRSLTAIYSAHPNGIQKLANIEKLVEISRRFQTEDNGSLHEFVKYGLNMADEEEEEGEAIIMSEEAGPISLMTIHAAKGLEFPMVIIPDLDRKLPVKTRNGKPVRLYRSDDIDTEKWNHEEGEIPLWPVEIAQLEYLKKYTPLGYLLMRRNRLEDIAENRRVFYVACTRARNHLILLGRVKKKDKKGQIHITSEDYRERATIQDILDDIYGFNINYASEEKKYYEEKDSSPGIVWYEPKTRAFRGIQYGKDRPDSKSLGTYDKRIETLDLSGPVKTNPYYQFSFTSVQTFMKCPIRFYLDVVLGLREKYLPQKITSDDTLLNGSVSEYEERFGYGSKEALFLGSFIHAYLERHDFGDEFDENLFNSILGNFKNTVENSSILKEKALGQIMNLTNDKVLIDLMKGKRDYREIPFLFSVKKGVEFRGVIDRIFRDEATGLWSIIDWKSNDLENRDPKEVIKENNYDMQLAFYRWAVENLLNEKVGKLYNYFADRGQLLEVDWKGNPIQILEEIIKKIKKYERNREEWEKDLDEIKNNGASCRFCEYQKNICF